VKGWLSFSTSIERRKTWSKLSDVNLGWINDNLLSYAGLPDFSWCYRENMSNDNKIYKMATIYTKRP
jgi:hypothetical protein